MNKITHLGVYQVHKAKLFEKVNSYTDLVKIIKKWGKDCQNEDDKEYNDKTGLAYEIYAQFWAMLFGHNNAINMKDLQDTSVNKHNRGYDFSYKDLFENPGMIQVKFRSAGNYQFHNGALDSFIQKARKLTKSNTVLFISIDDHAKLFHYDYEEIRDDIRIIDRKTQEYYINTYPNFWDELRKCIELSAKTEFKDKYTPRDVQDWILNGNKERGFLGTQAVINKLVPKGRIEAQTATGKTLCIHENIESAFTTGRKIVLVTIPWRALITQTFNDYYEQKLFGWEDDNGVIHNQGKPACIIMMSGQGVHYNSEIVDVFQNLNPDFIEGKIASHVINNNKNIVIFTTKESYKNWYDKKDGTGIFTNLINKKIINKDDVFEIFDEYHNMIPSSGERDEHLITAKFLATLSDRNSGALFYSASNKHGQLVSSFFEDQFGILLAKITRQDLYERGFVCPGLEFRVIKLKNIWASAEDKRKLEIDGVDLNKAQIEAAGINICYTDAKNYYSEPNIMTFGSHVPGCAFITNDKGMQNKLKDVNLHFMSADTPNSERSRIIDIIKKTGNNILNQHSVAKEGVNIPNLHVGLIHRNMELKEAQQAIGRSDRSLYEDTKNFQEGKITLDNPIGWKKYWNIIYLIVSDEEDIIFQNMMVDLIKYLKSNGIPKDKWSFSIVEDNERVGVKQKGNADYNTEYDVNFDIDKLNNIIKNAEIIAENELQSELTMDNIGIIDYDKEIADIQKETWMSLLSEGEYFHHMKTIAETTENDSNGK